MWSLLRNSIVAAGLTVGVLGARHVYHHNDWHSSTTIIVDEAALEGIPPRILKEWRTLDVSNYQRFAGQISLAAFHNSIDPDLIRAVILVESGYRSNARSPKGALGLMQLMPVTAQEVGVKDPFDPSENIKGGARYLRRMLDDFDDNLPLALAAYNAGPGAVRAHSGVPPYPETEQYVRKVLYAYGIIRGADAA